MLRDRLEMAHAHARRSLQNSAVRQKRNYDHKVNASQFNRGDQVWLFTPGRKVGISPKLQTFWDGPYTILERLGEVVYRLQRNPNNKMKVVHRDRLHKYLGDEPKWLSPTDTVNTTVPITDDNSNIATVPDETDCDLVTSPGILFTDDIAEEITDSAPGARRSRKPPNRYGQ